MLILPLKLRKVLRIASDVVQKLPTKDDGPLAVVVKAVAIAESVHSIGMGSYTSLAEMARDRGFEPRRSEQFVTLFFKTPLGASFSTRRYALTPYETVIEATALDGSGTLYFSACNGEVDENYYYSSGLQFGPVMARFWGEHEGRVHVSVSSYGWRTKTEYETFPRSANPLYGKAQGDLKAFQIRHLRYLKDNVAKTYLFLGAPGTGKTTFALRFAEALGYRTCKMDATSLLHVRAKEFGDLLTQLAPDVMILDDVDKADLAKVMPTILEILERVKATHPETTIILTANSAKGMDPGFVRPGRLLVRRFKLPTPAERRVVLSGYLPEGKLSDKELNLLVEKTEGMSQDYLREAAEQLNYDSFAEVLAAIDEMHEIKGEATGTKPAVKDTLAKEGAVDPTKTETPKPKRTRKPKVVAAPSGEVQLQETPQLAS
jgi:hypothetical protein